MASRTERRRWNEPLSDRATLTGNQEDQKGHRFNDLHPTDGEQAKGRPGRESNADDAEQWQQSERSEKIALNTGDDAEESEEDQEHDAHQHAFFVRLLLDAIGDRRGRRDEHLQQRRLILLVEKTKDCPFPFNRQLSTFSRRGVQRVAKTKDGDVSDELHHWGGNGARDAHRLSVGLVLRFVLIISADRRFVAHFKALAEHQGRNANGPRPVEIVLLSEEMEVLHGLTKGIGQEIVAIDHTGVIDSRAQR